MSPYDPIDYAAEHDRAVTVEARVHAERDSAALESLLRRAVHAGDPAGLLQA